jgi:hypothetical protein
MTSAFARQRVTLCQEGLPERTVWLVIKRTLGREPTYSSSISKAPVSTPLRTVVWLSGGRWAVEQCFEESKTELGMDQYEVRKYPGWHHHILTTRLAHVFLWQLKLRWGKKSPRADGVTGAEIAGGRVTLADVQRARRAHVSRLATAAQSQRVSCAEKPARDRGLNQVAL